MFEKDGIDTVDAYLRMNLPIDGRSYDAAVLILRYLGIQKLRLLTNNPLKIQAFNDSGIEVERVPIDIPPNPWNKDYLKTKKLRMGHLLGNL
jgi:3,4-dihydroxy 2-butanone 4-phosphate synthase/GTP cyclohydrolase II